MRRIVNSLAVCCVVAIAGCSAGPNERVSDALSPDKRLKAVVYIMRAGSINTDVINVSIVKPDDPIPKKGGNVFSSYMPQDVQVAWSNSSTLVVTLDAWKYGTHGETKACGVTVLYSPPEPKPPFNMSVNVEAAKETGKELIKVIQER
jgi:hypothetical protein